MPIQMNLLIVIRDFAKDYFNLIQDWGVNLIKDTINRRSLSQRNNPGQLARVGISEGQRNARMFGWVRNLKNRYRNASDQDEYEQSISLLFGLFYANKYHGLRKNLKRLCWSQECHD